ncbi:hypothetical protein [Nodosilinea sp. LEGE 07298]|uniref:hypothetical protein n=1 Tax=Nodosilinea sp. LEGE 07298 TaxID=2777970 RepID=UPI001D156602|nr:hypothetical protein [Nodosilinea sp. LEGE 07298]
MPQPHNYLLPNALLQSTAQPLSIDTILRPVSLDTGLNAGDGFSGYFTGVNLPGVAGMAGMAVTPEALSPVLAQQFDQDILGDMVSVWNNFVESGQLWALLFGIVLGYFIRNLTAF